LTLVLCFTPFCKASVKDLSNWASAPDSGKTVEADLLQNTHGELGRDIPLRNEFIERISQGCADTARQL
jgi:hypothetical protein